MKEWEDNKRKNACQIQFDDTDGQNTYKSLYLDTLGAAARSGQGGAVSAAVYYGSAARNMRNVLPAC